MGFLECRKTLAGAAAGLMILVAACGTSQDVADSPEKRNELAGNLAELAVELGAVASLLDEGADLGMDSSAASLELELGRALTDAERDQARGILRSVLADYVTADLWSEKVTRVYAESFTAGELQAMLDFYTSPAGRKSLEMEAALTREVDAGMEEVLDGRLEEFIDRVDDELAKVFPELAREESP